MVQVKRVRVEYTIWLGKDVLDGLVNCHRISKQKLCLVRSPSRTTVDGISILIWDFNGELLFVCQPCPSSGIYPGSLTSSMAMTTSTVSKESSPRSLLKWEVGESYNW